MLYTHWWYFWCFCMVSQLPCCDMIRPNSRFPGIDLLPHRATSAFSTSSELLLDLQVGFGSHVVVYFWKKQSFWIVLQNLGTKRNRTSIGLLFFGGQVFTTEVDDSCFTEGGSPEYFSWWSFRLKSVRNMDVEPSCACDSSRVKRTSTRSSEAGGPIFLVSLGRFSCPLEIF